MLDGGEDLRVPVNQQRGAPTRLSRPGRLAQPGCACACACACACESRAFPRARRIPPPPPPPPRRIARSIILPQPGTWQPRRIPAPRPAVLKRIPSRRRVFDASSSEVLGWGFPVMVVPGGYLDGLMTACCGVRGTLRRLLGWGSGVMVPPAFQRGCQRGTLGAGCS